MRGFFPRYYPLLLGGTKIPYWVLGAAGGYPASIDMNFAAGLYYGRTPADLTVTRATPTLAYANTTSGVLQGFAPNTARITDLGLLVEEARTNVVLWNRDLTNVAWVPVNVTAALDQVGADGTANSASSLTATVANGTILQTIVLASSARFQSAFVRRLVGTGVINMTMDGGLTWTPITVTSSYTQLSIPTQTLANPIVGFQIVTSGDSIAIDFIQNENGISATSPMSVTTGAITRAAEVIVLTSPAFGTSYSIYSQGIPNSPTNYGASQFAISLDSGSATNRLFLGRAVTTGVAFAQNTSASVTTNLVGAGWSQNTSGKSAVATATGSQAFAFDGGSPVTGAGNLPIGVANVRVGSNGGTAQWNGYLARLAIWPSIRLPNVELQVITSP